MRSLSSTFVLFSLMTASQVLLGGCRERELSEAQATEIRDLFLDEDANSYRLQLPVFENGKATRTEVYGALPLDQVRLIASREGVEFQPDLQIAIWDLGGNTAGNGGQGGVAGVGGGSGGSMETTQSKKIDRLRSILQEMDPKSYQLLIGGGSAGPQSGS
ncbi:MAG TPA: hypothetical protein VNW71_11475 [Thermoanaerobaculia bacterium]|nr:hypothetical protein [Thermoanaerobaculia bacterium]